MSLSIDSGRQIDDTSYEDTPNRGSAEIESHLRDNEIQKITKVKLCLPAMPNAYKYPKVMAK